MKQSTKLLSLVLALLMAFSCMSVIGNATLVKSEVTWDNIDDAALTAEQVADLALDLVENDLLADIEPIDLSILGKLRLNKIDYIYEDILKLRSGWAWAIGSGLLKNLGAMDFKPLSKSSGWDPYQRSDGDLVIICSLLEFIGNDNNSEIVSRIAYGLGDGGKINSNGDLSNTAQLNLGLISKFLDLGEIGDMLNDIPGMVVGLLYDMLVFGSYGYDKKLEELKEAGQAIPSEVNTLDKMVNEVLYNVFTQPQDYEWEGKGEDAVKIWDEHSYISKTLRSKSESDVKEMINPTTNSLFKILDNLAQIAIDDFGVPALNNNLKKALMEAVEVDFNEMDKANLPADIKAAFELTTPEYERSYVNYIGYDCLKKSSNNLWYYTTIKTETLLDPVTGEPVLDKDGNEETERVRKFYRANFGSANEFATLINWDWKFVRSDSSEAGTKIDYKDILSVDGSIAGGLNNLLGLVYDTALTAETKAAYEAMTGRKGWVKGTNAANINANIVNVTKYVLCNFGERVFGSDSPYAHYTWDQLKDLDIVDMVALIGPGFFEEAMPQILLPKNADGTYAFHDDKQIFEFGAVVIRELITGIAPNVNYDSVIFKGGSVDAQGAAGRQYADHSIDEWFNIILNMGTDLGVTYLDQITNFRDFCAAEYGEGFDLDAWLTTNAGSDESHWIANLNTAILWAVQYVGCERSSSVLSGLDYESVSSFEHPFDKLSYILNTILPLGFVNGYSSDDFDLDAKLLVEGVKTLFTTFDLNVIINLFGRNQKSYYNFLDDTNVANAVLTLVNNILQLVLPGENILQGVNGMDNLTGAQSLDKILQPANLKKTVALLLRQLHGNQVTPGYDKKDSDNILLLNALPVLGKLIKGWGTEQKFQRPDISLSRSITATNGAISEAQKVTVRNASNGVWRHYRDANGVEDTDNQYKIQLTSVAAYNFDGTPSSYITPTLVTTAALDYGQSGTFTYVTKANVPTTGAIVRFDIKYKVFDEDGAQIGGKEFITRTYSYINYNGSDAGTTTKTGGTNLEISWGTIRQYIDMSALPSSIENAELIYIQKDKSSNLADKPTIYVTSGSGDGLTNFTSSSVKLNDGNRVWKLTPYKSQDIWCSGGNAGTQGKDEVDENQITITSDGFNEANWTALNKKSGDTGSVTANFAGKYPKKPILVWSDMKSYTGSVTTTFRYYDGAAKSRLASLVVSEMEAMRLANAYNITGTSYAGEVLIAEDEGTDIYAKDFKLRETNFKTTGYDPEEDVPENGEPTEVTKIDNAQAWKTYQTAFQAAIRGAFCEFNEYAVYNYQELYNALKVAANDVNYLRKTTAELVASGKDVDDVEGDIDALETLLVAAEGRTTDHHNHTDYKMYRLNRFIDGRDDANYYINLKKDANKSLDDVMTCFDYNWMDGADYKALIDAHSYKEYDAASNSVKTVNVARQADYDILVALLEDIDEEELAGKEEWLDARKAEYGSTQLLDVQMATKYLQLTEQRLLTRNHGVLTVQLEDEINSAKQEVLAQNAYTAGSWANYAKALARAEEVLAAKNSQKEAFDAKYELIVNRKRLVKVADAGDYTELDALIAQAKHALANKGLYDNGAKDFGMVLAELGMDPIPSQNGDIQLFPGSALLIKDRAFGADNQDNIDGAAAELKEALARLKFKNVEIAGATSIGEETLVEADEEAGIEEIKATVAHINANLLPAQVKKLFTVKADNAVVGEDNITVSSDIHYSVTKFDKVTGEVVEDLEGFAGTGSTVTFYTLQGTVKIPVATVKLVVDGDLNGDGAVDVLDASYAALVASKKANLEGCYLLAGDLVGADRELTAEDDYGQIINKVVA